MLFIFLSGMPASKEHINWQLPGATCCFTWTASFWEWIQTEQRKGEIKNSQQLNSWSQPRLKTVSSFESLSSLCAKDRLSCVVICNQNNHDWKKRVSVFFFFLAFIKVSKLNGDSMEKNLLVCFLFMKILIMLLFQQWFHVRDNF